MPAHTTPAPLATHSDPPAPYEFAAAKIRVAYKAAGFPIDENGIKRLLVSLRALGLVDWQDAPVGAMMPPDVRS